MPPNMSDFLAFFDICPFACAKILSETFFFANFQKFPQEHPAEIRFCDFVQWTQKGDRGFILGGMDKDFNTPCAAQFLMHPPLLNFFFGFSAGQGDLYGRSNQLMQGVGAKMNFI